MDFKLSERTMGIFSELEKHCKERMKFEAIDYLELQMLANSFANYFDAAEFCSQNGTTYVMKSKTGDYEQMRPQFLVMKTETANIKSMSANFGITPGDRERLFKKLADKKPKKAFDLTSKD